MVFSVNFQRVVHATDFSSGVAFDHALNIALAAKGDLTVIHVAHDRARAGAEWNAFPAVRQTLERWGKLGADAPASEVSGRLGLHVVKHDLAGRSPVSALLAKLHDEPIDLLVLGSGVRTGLGRALHPSVSESLARRARAPTLFIPDGCSGFVDKAGQVRLGRILLPVGGHILPHRAIQRARDLAGLLDQAPEIHIIKVGGASGVRVEGLGDDDAIHHAVRTGPLVETIADYANEIDADLIVMSSAGHDSLRDTALGSTTEQVLRACGRALLAVPV